MGKVLEFTDDNGVAARELRVKNRFKDPTYTVDQFADDLLYCDLVKLNLTYAPLISILEELQCFKESDECIN